MRLNMRRRAMLKILSLLIIAMMVLHIIKPLGWPGLKKRRDFWKLALFAIAGTTIAVLLGHG